MEVETVRILMIDDDEDDFLITRDLLLQNTNKRYEVEWIGNVQEAERAIMAAQHDLYLIDYHLGERTGLELLHQAIEHGCTKPIIILTGQGNSEVNIQALKDGAADYLVKDHLSADNLDRSIRHSVEQAKMLESLYEKEQKYRTLFEKSIDAIYITDQSGKFIDVNPSMLSLLGLEREAMLQMQLKDLFRDPEDHAQFIEQQGRDNVVKDFETQLRTSDGERVFCIINATALRNQDNETTGMQGVIHDITERIKAEQEVMRSEKINMSARITRSIAHEVRNPLTNIKLALEQMKEAEAGEDLSFYNDIITRSTDRIGDLINQLVQTTRPTKLDLQQYPVNRLLDEVLELTGDRTRLLEVDLEKAYDPAAGEIHVDVEKMKTALLNILINAIEALPEKEGRIKVASYCAEHKCQVAIEDNGPGIPQENLIKLFDPFYSGKESGMGLGLTTTQNIIKSHKGLIDVESELGKGTRFVITFAARS